MAQQLEDGRLLLDAHGGDEVLVGRPLWRRPVARGRRERLLPLPFEQVLHFGVGGFGVGLLVDRLQGGVGSGLFDGLGGGLRDPQAGEFPHVGVAAFQRLEVLAGLQVLPHGCQQLVLGLVELFAECGDLLEGGGAVLLAPGAGRCQVQGLLRRQQMVAFERLPSGVDVDRGLEPRQLLRADLRHRRAGTGSPALTGMGYGKDHQGQHEWDRCESSVNRLHVDLRMLGVIRTARGAVAQHRHG